MFFFFYLHCSAFLVLCFIVYKKNPDFVTRGRVWAVAAGVPHAGKSPTFEWTLRNMVQEHASAFPWVRDAPPLRLQSTWLVQRNIAGHRWRMSTCRFGGPQHARPALPNNLRPHEYERVDRHAEAPRECQGRSVRVGHLR